MKNIFILLFFVSLTFSVNGQILFEYDLSDHTSTNIIFLKNNPPNYLIKTNSNIFPYLMLYKSGNSNEESGIFFDKYKKPESLLSNTFNDPYLVCHSLDTTIFSYGDKIYPAVYDSAYSQMQVFFCNPYLTKTKIKSFKEKDRKTYQKTSKSIKKHQKYVKHIWISKIKQKYFVFELIWDNSGITISFEAFFSEKEAITEIKNNE